jgi:hypothetical protein
LFAAAAAVRHSPLNISKDMAPKPLIFGVVMYFTYTY